MTKLPHATLRDETGVSIAAVPGLDVDLREFRNSFLRHRPGRVQQHGPCGARIRLYASSGVCNGSVLVSQADFDDAEWIHASIARENHMPSYDDLTALKRGVFGPDRYAFQVFPPIARHVSIHTRALHLWGRADGASPLPDFGRFGTI